MTTIALYILLIIMPVIVVTIGLSLLSQSMNALDYNQTEKRQHNYLSNPLIKLGSKYYSWRPDGAILITKEKWQKIEKNIYHEIDSARKEGIKLGRDVVLAKIENAICQRPKNPYTILKLNMDEADKVNTRETELLAKYNPRNFDYLNDKEFTRLAEIRVEEVKIAARKLRNGLGLKKNG